MQHDMVWSGVSMTAGKHVARAAIAGFAAVVILFLAPAGAAMAAPPNVAIDAPLTGSSTNDQTPAFSGTTDDTLDQITLEIYAGATATGSPVQAPTALPVPLEGRWSAVPASPLAPGEYTAVAVQTNGESETGTSSPVTFIIDTTPPAVSLNAPPAWTDAPTPTLTGDAGTAVGDEPLVLVTIYRGGSVGGSIAAAQAVIPSGAKWSYTAPHLSDGTYTAQASQSDEAGNTGTSAPATFTVDTTPPALVMQSPANGAVVNAAIPTFSGLAGQADGDRSLVTVKIYAGASASGAPVQIVDLTPDEGLWSTDASGPALLDGIYTARAEQADDAGNIATSTATFTIATSDPVVTLATSGLVMRQSGAFTGPTPSFAGSASSAPEDSTSVILDIYAGISVSGMPVQRLEGPVSGSGWSVGPVALANGTYTVQAEQGTTDPFGQAGVSAPSTFTVDGTAPQPTLGSPADGSSTSGESEAISGSAATAEGDLPAITIQLFAGATASGHAPLEQITVQAVRGGWTAAFGGLSPGTYTVRAEQDDDVGNTGFSAPVSFTVRAPEPVAPTAPGTTAVTAPATSAPVPSPPVASFQWFPAAPRTGEAVSLASTASAGSSPITGFAWDPTGTGVFATGGPVFSTSFSSPGAHVVHLSVTDADGLSSVVAETITVSAPQPILMQPFPVVRIAGTENAAGVKVSLLTVQAPVGAMVSVTCRGPGCPTSRSQNVVAVAGRTSGKAGAVVIDFRRFERALRAGAILEIRVTEPGQIGKYTHFVVRHGRLPARTDTCLSADGITPIACPST
jgi:Big-like domain-containing protein